MCASLLVRHDKFAMETENMKRIMTGLVCMLVCMNAFARTVVIDVRTPQEYAEGHIEGALNIEYQNIDRNIGMAGVGKDDEIILYCHSGRRAGIARESLRNRGFMHVENYGGLEDAKAKLGGHQKP